MTTYYVSPSGNDSNPGTISAPWLTPAHAIANAASDDTILFRGSRYSITSTITIPVTNLTLTAYPGETPVFDGGVRPVGTWSTYSGAIKVIPYTANLAPRSIWINGVRAFRSRTGTGIAGCAVSVGGYTSTGGALSTDPNPTLVEFLYRGPFFTQRNKMVSAGASTITMQATPHALITVDPKFGDSIYAGKPTDIENSWAPFLAQQVPGWFYYDASGTINGVPSLFYVPRHGEDLTTAEVVVADALECFLSGTNADNTTISGITFQYTNWAMSQGFAEYAQCHFAIATPTNDVGGYDPDAVYATPGVYFTTSTGVTITNCVFRHFGSEGPTADVKCDGFTFTGNTLYDMDLNGVRVGSVGELMLTTCASGVTIKNNVFRRIGRNFHGSGIVTELVTASTIIHNDIQDTAYCGIASGDGGGNFPDAAVPTDNVISHNRIANNLQLSSDAGSLYVQSTADNVEISSNVIINLSLNFIGSGGAEGGASGIYLDNGNQGFVVNNNIMINTAVSGRVNAPAGSNTIGTNYATSPSAPISFTEPTTISDLTDSTVWGIYSAAGLEAAHQSLLVPFQTLLPLQTWPEFIADENPVLWLKLTDKNDSSANAYTTANSATPPTYTNDSLIPNASAADCASFGGSSYIEVQTLELPIGKSLPFYLRFVVTPNFTRDAFEYQAIFASRDKSTSAEAGIDIGMFYNLTFITPNNSVCLGFQMINNVAGVDYFAVNGSFDFQNDTTYLVEIFYDGSGTAQGVKVKINGRYDTLQYKPAHSHIVGAAVSAKYPRLGAYSDGSSGWKGVLQDVVMLDYIPSGLQSAHAANIALQPTKTAIGLDAVSFSQPVVFDAGEAVYELLLASSLAARSDVRDGMTNGQDTGTYPTTETTQAAQLATDTAAVAAEANKILNGTTILGVAGTALKTTPAFYEHR